MVFSRLCTILKEFSSLDPTVVVIVELLCVLIGSVFICLN